MLWLLIILLNNVILIIMKNYTKKELYQIEKAILFMVKYFDQYCTNPKPIILHSTKVGMVLYNYKIPVEFVIAGILHDVVEDTRCTIEIISKQFGKKICRIISSLTMDFEKMDNVFVDYKERWIDHEKRLNKIGKYVWLIKFIDGFDNLQYYSKILKSEKRIYEMIWKHNLIIRNSKKYWSSMSEFKEYINLVIKINKKWKIKF